MKKRQIVKLIIVLFLITISILSIYSFVTRKSEVNEYVLNNNQFDLIRLDKYDVFLSGEDHTMAKSIEFKKSIFSYLNKYGNVKNIIIEDGFCSGLLLNRYLQTGNKKDLDFYMEQLKGTLAYNQENCEFYKWLYKYNLNLVDEDKITIYGLDIEHQPLTAIKGISTLIDMDKEVPESLERAIGYLKKNDNNAISYLKLAYDKNREDCEEYFGDNFTVFENCIKNYYYEDDGSDMRDKIMMDNFSFIYSLNEGEKFFGQLGYKHIFQDYLDSDYMNRDEVRFGILLNSNKSPVKDKVYSLLCVYKNANDNSPSEKSFDYSLVKNCKEDMFVDLSQPDSPFYEKNYLLKDKKCTGVTCDYIQGLMILINSDETNPL